MRGSAACASFALHGHVRQHAQTLALHRPSDAAQSSQIPGLSHHAAVGGRPCQTRLSAQKARAYPGGNFSSHSTYSVASGRRTQVIASSVDDASQFMSPDVDAAALSPPTGPRQQQVPSSGGIKANIPLPRRHQWVSLQITIAFQFSLSDSIYANFSAVYDHLLLNITN